MKIKISIGKTTTTLKWHTTEGDVSLKFPGIVDAEWSELKNLVVVAGEDSIYILNTGGEKISEFYYQNSETCRFYSLAKNTLTELGVTVVMAHTPEYNGERFWQHDIDITNKKVGGPIEKWR